REALADFAERQSLDQFGAAPEPTGEHFERGQGDLRMLDAEPPHVAPVNEECARLLFGGDGRGERAVVEDGHFGHGRARALDVDDLLAPLDTLAESAHRPLDDDEEAARLLARDEEHLVAREAAPDRAPGERAERAAAQPPEERSAPEGRDLVHRPSSSRPTARNGKDKKIPPHHHDSNTHPSAFVRDIRRVTL